MRIPQTPPAAQSLLQTLLNTPEGMEKLQNLVSNVGPLVGEKYRHWETLRRLPPPDTLTHEEWWQGIKFARKALLQETPVKDAGGRPFKFSLPAPALSLLHQLDRRLGGLVAAPPEAVNPESRDLYLIRSLMEEAITSSQLEGAATTASRAKEMILKKEAPKDAGEQMILNNYRAMLHLRTLKDEPLTPEKILEIHRVMTEKTLALPEKAGELRGEGDPVRVTDMEGETLYTPPPARELPARMRALCEFANAGPDEKFIHPIVRAILVHFWLAVDHPFVDGNGRTARALFYRQLIREGYWLAEFISISRVVRAAPARYARAFLYSETDDNDATYFVLNQLKVLAQATDGLYRYITEKSRQIKEMESVLFKVRRLKTLNYRQVQLIVHAAKHPSATYTLEGYKNLNQVTYETARKDLLQLEREKLLYKQKSGKTFVFFPALDLAPRLKKMGGTFA